MNRCSKCGRLVAGHLAKFGVPHGPRCTLTPLSHTEISAEGGDSSEMSGTEGTDLVGMSSPQVTSAPDTLTTVSTPAAAAVSGSGPSTSSSGTVTLTNEQLEAEYIRKYNVLKLQLQDAEAKAKQQTLDNICRLDEQNRYMQDRLNLLSSTATLQLPVNSTVSAPPATSTSGLISSIAPFAPPPTTAGIAASSFGQSASTFIHGNPASASLSLGTASTPSMTSSGGIPHSSSGQSAAASQQPFGIGLHSSWPSLENPSQGQMATNNFMNINSASNASNMVPNSCNQAMSMPDIQSALLASNPQLLSSMNVKPDDIIKVNSLARVMAGFPAQDAQKDEASVLGKYIPELYSIKYGKIEDIRARMTYHEFIAMYIRMLVTMLRDDPALLPDRLTFLNAFTSKAARHKWPAVRNAYTSAMHQLKHGRRKWADDLTEVFADHLDTHTMVRSDHPNASSGPSHHAKVPFPCRDWNEKVCNRTVCKFFHECSRCHQDHPLKFCAGGGSFSNTASQ